MTEDKVNKTLKVHLGEITINKNTKRCTKCKKTYPATTEYFHRNAHKKDGLNYQCKICISNNYKENRLSLVSKTYLANEILRKNNLKICKKCSKIYPANTKYFYRNKRLKDGLNFYCKECEKIRYKKIHIKKTYGIKFEEIQEMIKKQTNQCPICKRLLGDFLNGENDDIYPRVDHDHKSGEIRSLLCNTCNLLIGYAFENPIILINAIKYLRKYKKHKIKN